MKITIRKTDKPLIGTLRPESDKSITQRVILFALLTEEKCVFEKISQALDPQSTLKAAEILGLRYQLQGDTLITKGPGFYNMLEPNAPIFCGNSGTLMRFLMGLLAPSSIFTVLTGDESLNRRPMARVAEPLKQMGGIVLSRKGGLAPLAVSGTNLKGIDYTLPVASAQLKSALILAALNSQGPSIINEKIPSRDHTERLLKAMGAEITTNNHSILVQPTKNLTGISLKVGGDFSAAAFFIGAGLLVESSELILSEVNLNPTRTGLLNVLERMGAKFTIEKFDDIEPIGSIYVRGSNLHGTEISQAEIPALIDEIPLLAVLSARAEGETVIKGVGELRVKESDRLKGILALLKVLGREGLVTGEGENLTLTIKGKPGDFDGGLFNPMHDHRLAMASAVAALNSPKGIYILDAEVAQVSQPEFYSQLAQLGVDIQ